MELADKLSKLASMANSDGGWGYGARSSWTEPTVLALLALGLQPERFKSQINAAERWLQHVRRSDGGWAPQVQIRESTWVTSLVLLLQPHQESAAIWLLRQTPPNSTAVFRFRAWMAGQSSGENHAGMNWYPGTAAWVAPTCFGILALRKAKTQQVECRRRAGEGEAFLLEHACKDGGWNHGSSRALGYEIGPYPEMTGLALLALTGRQDSPVQRALSQAQKEFWRAPSAEAESWLRLGLAAHGIETDCGPRGARTAGELALSILADAGEQGVKQFV